MTEFRLGLLLGQIRQRARDRCVPTLRGVLISKARADRAVAEACHQLSQAGASGSGSVAPVWRKSWNLRSGRPAAERAG